MESEVKELLPRYKNIIIMEKGIINIYEDDDDDEDFKFGLENVNEDVTTFLKNNKRTKKKFDTKENQTDIENISQHIFEKRKLTEKKEQVANNSREKIIKQKNKARTKIKTKNEKSEKNINSKLVLKSQYANIPMRQATKQEYIPKSLFASTCCNKTTKRNKPKNPKDVLTALTNIKNEVETAVANRRTFSIVGHFPDVRNALLKRGWIEKFHSNFLRNEPVRSDLRKFSKYSIPELVELMRRKDLTEVSQKLIKSKLLEEYQVDFFWARDFDAFKECSDNVKLTTINTIRCKDISFTSKEGLCETVNESHWFSVPDLAHIKHPRCYVLSKNSDAKSFKEDFGMTAAISLLKWIVLNDFTKESKVVSSSGKIPMISYYFTLSECDKFIKKQQHKDLDEEIAETPEQKWNEFIETFYKIVHIGNHFKLDNDENNEQKVEEEMVQTSTYLLTVLKKYVPNFDVDGCMNIWILKPTNWNQGRGIQISRCLKHILNIVKNNPKRKFVVQKYLEKPLLIHNAKFDIRQWFLVSSTHPLTIWIYKICYLRFSSQTFNLRNLHESIHLTNNAIQCKYIQTFKRDPILPNCNMWDAKKFQNYLSNIGYPNVFQEIIYKGMKECIVAAVISHREKMNKRRNCFEIYGADFILDEDFQPWLLEINANPALQNSSPVTTRLVPEVLEDVVKVMVDCISNGESFAGNFEKIYEENKDHIKVNPKSKLQLTGTSLAKDYYKSIPPGYILDKDNNSLISIDKFNILLKNNYDFINVDKKSNYISDNLMTQEKTDVLMDTFLDENILNAYKEMIPKFNCENTITQKEIYEFKTKLSSGVISTANNQLYIPIVGDILKMQEKADSFLKKSASDRDFLNADKELINDAFIVQKTITDDLEVDFSLKTKTEIDKWIESLVKEDKMDDEFLRRNEEAVEKVIGVLSYLKKGK